MRVTRHPLHSVFSPCLGDAKNASFGCFYARDQFVTLLSRSARDKCLENIALTGDSFAATVRDGEECGEQGSWGH